MVYRLLPKFLLFPAAFFVCLNAEAQNIQTFIDYDFDDMKNLSIGVSAIGFDIDRTGNSNPNYLQLNYFNGPISAEARFSPPYSIISIYEGKNATLPGYQITHIPFEGNIVLGIDDKIKTTSSRVYNTNNKSRFIDMQTKDWIVYGIRAGYFSLHSMTEALVANGRTSYHALTTRNLYMGIDIKRIRHYSARVPEYEAERGRHNTSHTFIDVFYAPTIQVDSVYNGITYDVSALKKIPFGLRAGWQTQSTNRFGVYFRTEGGIRPGYQVKMPFYYVMAGFGFSASFKAGPVFGNYPE